MDEYTTRHHTYNPHTHARSTSSREPAPPPPTCPPPAPPPIPQSGEAPNLIGDFLPKCVGIIDWAKEHWLVILLVLAGIVWYFYLR